MLNKKSTNKRANTSKKDNTDLSKIRIVQTHIVYISGLQKQTATQEILQKPEYMGQYGKIQKIILNDKYEKQEKNNS